MCPNDLRILLHRAFEELIGILCQLRASPKDAAKLVLLEFY